MRYQHKQIDIGDYINTLYDDGLVKSKLLDDEAIAKKLSHIGIFKFKGYVKAFRDKLYDYTIDDILYLYEFDRVLSTNLFHMLSEIEIKLKSHLVEIVYEISSNPFSYLEKHNYKSDFTLAKDSLYTWEVKENSTKAELYPHYRDYYLGRYDFESNFQDYLKDKELLKLQNDKNINYPPFHYFIESATLGVVINLISKLQIDNQDILKLVGRKFGVLNANVFMSYILRVKELRNRTAHNGRIFNRNYRSVKAIGKYKLIRKGLYDHRLLDVYYTVLFLLQKEKEIFNSKDLQEKFVADNFKSESSKMEEFILSCMRKR